MIEMPKDGDEPWIRISVQRIESNGDIYNVIERWDSFHKRFSEVAGVSYPSVTGPSDGFFTVAHVAAEISYVVKLWLAEKYTGVIDSTTGDVIIGE